MVSTWPFGLSGGVFCYDYRYPIRAPAPKTGHHFTSPNWQNGDLEKRSRLDEILDSISVSNLPNTTKAASAAFVVTILCWLETSVIR